MLWLPTQDWVPRRTLHLRNTPGVFLSTFLLLCRLNSAPSVVGPHKTKINLLWDDVWRGITLPKEISQDQDLLLVPAGL